MLKSVGLTFLFPYCRINISKTNVIDLYMETHLKKVGFMLQHFPTKNYKRIVPVMRHKVRDSHESRSPVQEKGHQPVNAPGSQLNE